MANGNISRMAHLLAHGNAAYGESRSAIYFYDKLNRLIMLKDLVEYAFDEMFEYDAQGRIVSQRRAENIGNASGGEYAYESGSNRLKSVAAGMGGTAGSRDMSDADNFVYDQDGNLVEDSSKSLTISYDWRDLPVEFTRETCTDYSGYVFCDSTKLIMAYDGAGRRISKTRMKKTAFDGPWYATLVTHYTGIGTEIRENPVNHEAKVVMNMPNGLGRYEPEDAAVPPSSSTSRTFEWCLKNHLGSTMLVYASAYGTPIELVSTNGADMRRWQSKEFDWLYGKFNFGARYYDPFFGLWMSPDPAGQFANPYTYGGDPLNYVDPTGMWAGGVGLVVSWDEQHGWGFGVGSAAEVGRYGINTSYMFHQDGSNTLDLGVDAKIPIQTPYVYLEINIGLGFSMNSYTGAVLSSHGGACVGEAGTCVGVDQGNSLYFDRGGGFQGMTVYTEVYVQIAGEARISTGYEAGLFGAEGRGMYAGVSGYGLHAELTHLDGGADAVEANYGMTQKAYLGYGNNTGAVDTNGNKKGNIVSMELWLPTLGKHFTFGDEYDVSKDGLNKALLNAIEKNFGKEFCNAYDNEKDFGKKAVMLNDAMLAAGFVETEHLNLLHGDGVKTTYARAGLLGKIWGNWGNIEIVTDYTKTGKPINLYSSYNYGNHWWTHLMIDVIGYYAQKY